MGIAAGIDEFSASARMNHYEIGRHTPDYSVLKRIARALKVPPAFFYAESDELAEFILIFSQFKKTKQRVLLNEISKQSNNQAK